MMRFTRAIRRYFCQAKQETNHQPLSKEQLSAVQIIITTTLRNLYFLQHNLNIVFTTSIILNNDNLRPLRKLNNHHIQLTKSKLIKYHAAPPLVGYLDLESLVFRGALLLQASKKYEIGKTLRRLEDNVDERLREMNVLDVEEKEFREYLVGIREDYHPFSEEYLGQPRPKIYDCVEQNLVGSFFNKIVDKYKKK